MEWMHLDVEALYLRTQKNVTRLLSQMAEEIGFSIKTMDRSIKKLEEDGMLRLEKGKIQVDQSGYLEMKEYIEQCIEGRS